MIKLMVIGNLGRDCVVNEVGGKKVINFSVAHSERYKGKGGEMVDRLVWVECAYWSERDGVVPYLKKGVKVFVEGSCEVREYDKKDGGKGFSLSMRVIGLQLLGGKDVEGVAGGVGVGGGSGTNVVGNSVGDAKIVNLFEDGRNDDLPF